jgi:hypothetical protein
VRTGVRLRHRTFVANDSVSGRRRPLRTPVLLKLGFCMEGVPARPPKRLKKRSPSFPFGIGHQGRQQIVSTRKGSDPSSGRPHPEEGGSGLFNVNITPTSSNPTQPQATYGHKRPSFLTFRTRDLEGRRQLHHHP